MKIILKEPDGPYHCTLDPDVMQVTLKEVFIGVSLETEGGEKLLVSMRDNGFEVFYCGDDGFNAGWTDFKDGVITVRNKKV